MRCRFRLTEHRDAFDGLCIPWIGGGYRVGAGRRRAGCSVPTAERVANATAIVAFDRRKAFSPAHDDRTSTADAKGSASRRSGAIRQAIDPDDRSTPKHLSRLLSGVKADTRRRSQAAAENAEEACVHLEIDRIQDEAIN